MLNKRRIKIKYLFLIAIIFNTGCLSLAEEAGRLIDGTASGERTITAFKSDAQDAQNEIKINIIENKENKKSIIISLQKYKNNRC